MKGTTTKMPTPENGIIQTYTHFNKRAGSMVKIICDTDFATHTKEMQEFADLLAMQVAAMPALNVESLQSQPLIIDSDVTVLMRLNSLRELLKENIFIADFARRALK